MRDREEGLSAAGRGVQITLFNYQLLITLYIYLRNVQLKLDIIILKFLFHYLFIQPTTFIF